MSANKQLIADLKATKDVLATSGRCRMVLENYSGQVCLDGAVAVACGATADWKALRTSKRASAVLQALSAQLPERFREMGSTCDLSNEIIQVYCFNDWDSTTDQDCFDLIDKALAQVGGLA